MKNATIAVGTMLVVQVMISISVLSLGVMMPAIAADLAINPKLVGVFTALTYAVAAGTSLAAAGPIVRLGAVRVCQFALVMAAIGLAVNAIAMVAATVVSVLFIGLAQGPINPAAAHILAQRVPRQWFGTVFSIKQSGTPLGFALAGVIFPALLAVTDWRGASLIAGAAALAAAIILEPLRPRLDVVVVAAKPSQGIWHSFRFVMTHPQLKVLGWAAFAYVIAQHTFTFYLVTYLYQQNGMTIAQAGALLSASQIAGTVLRLVSGWLGDRFSRLKLLGWSGIAMTVGCVATSLLAPDSSFWLVTVVIVGYGAAVISWNGTSQAEFAHLAPPGEVAAVGAVQNALAFSGAVVGPPLFAVIASFASYRLAFLAVAACLLAVAVWQIVAARRPVVT
ncbi:MAG: MFS transporter [Reyranella sp.]|uniref:MFS transporter n=1 Tax=Reyranella sp. TaxID=1929291 RepID=UPI002731995B|nr:MFS transporter [Reyranella sp.]MDP1964855.1 MFS transporter [Reyranella sp.]MDP2375244.1 MFS transporter [Reyranella sp.]